MLLKVCAVLLAAQAVLCQQSHPQLQAYLAAQQQQQQQQQQQHQPARQQYRLIQPAQVQQYTDEDSAPQYQQVQALPQQLVQRVHQPQYQQPLYRTAQGASQGQRLRQEDLQQNPEDYDPNPQYQFGFDVKDDQFTNYQNRKEQRDGDKITGSYSVVDSDGFIRTVTYTADPKEGFKAEVTRTPTDIVVKLPTPPPQQLQDAHGLQRQLSARQQQYLQAGPDHQSSQHQQYVRPAAAYSQPSASQLQQLQALAAQQRQHGGQLLRASPSSSAAAHLSAAAARYTSQPAADSVVYQAYQHPQQ